MRGALSLLLCLCGAGAARPEEASRPLVVDVYPQWEGGASRAEVLSRRMDRLDGSFRAICIGCGRGSSETGAHFYPYQVLNAPLSGPALD